MLYDVNEKREQDMILEAFGDYIRGQDCFDIVYSEKFGYLWVSPKREMDFAMKRLKTVERMLKSFFHDIIDDVIYSPDNPSQEKEAGFKLTEYEVRESRRRITAILETIKTENRLRYLDMMDAYIKEFSNELKAEYKWDWEE